MSEVARCWRCGKALTDAVSIAAGIGPRCEAAFEAEAVAVNAEIEIPLPFAAQPRGETCLA